MSKDLELRLRLTATDKNVAGTVRNTKKEVQGLSGSLGTVNTASRGTAAGMSAVTTAGGEATRMFKLQKGSLQQAGYQFQDFAVQVGSGTSAFVALGQQGSQLLGILGPGGALLGAVLAISSVVGGVLVNSMGDGEKAIDALDASMDRLNKTAEKSDGLTVLTEQIRELARESEVAARARISSAMQDAQKASEAAARGIGEAFGDLPISDMFGLKDLEDFTSSLGTFEAYLQAGYIQDDLTDLGEMFGLSGEKAQQAGRQIGELLTQLRANPSGDNFRALEDAMGTLVQEGGKPSQGILQLVGDLGTYFDSARDATDRTAYLQKALEDMGVAAGDQGATSELQKMIAALEAKAAAIGETNRQTDLRIAKDLNATETQRAAINQAYNAIEAEDARQESLKKSAEAAREADRAQRDFENSVSSLVDQLDPLGAQFASVYEKQQLLIQAGQQGLISDSQRDTLITGLVTDLSDAGDEYEKWTQSLVDSIDPMQKAEKEIAKIWDAFENDKLGDIDSSQVQDYVESMREGAKGVTDGWTDAGRAMDQFADSTANSLRTLQGLFKEGDSGYKQLSVGIQGLNTLQAINAVLNQSSGDAYTAWGRMFAMAMNVASLGYAVGSLNGSDVDPTAERQENQGTGTVLGDVLAKSESIPNGIESIADTNKELVNINTGMLRALERVEGGISGASALVQRSAAQTQFSAGSNNNLITSNLDLANTLGTVPLLDEVVLEELLGFSLSGFIMDIGDGLIRSAFGGDKKVVDDGIQIIGGRLNDLVQNTLVRAYAEIKTDGGWFSSDDYDLKFEALPAESRRQFALTFEAISDSVRSGADSLGLATGHIQRAFAGFEVATQLLSLEDLDAEEQRAELEAYFGTVFDNLAGSVVPFLDQFQRSGEGLGETLARLSTQVQLVQEGVASLGFGDEMYQWADGNMGAIEMRQLDPEAYARASAALTEGVGGAEAFARAISSIEDNFLTEAQKFENVQRRLSEALGEIPLPEMREGYLELIQAQRIGISGDQDRLATLLRLEDAADEYYDYLEQSSKSATESAREALANLTDATDSAFNKLRASIQSQQDSISEGYRADQETIRAEMDARLSANQMALSAAREGLGAIRQEVSALGSVTDSLRETFQPIQDIRRFDALEMLRDALSTGDLSGVGEAASVVGSVNARDYATRVDYERAQGRSLALLSALENEGTQQLTAAEQSVAALQRQTDMIRQQGENALEQAEEAYQEEVDRLDRIIEGAEREINALRGIETGVLSVVSAIEGLGAALGQEIAGDNSLSEMGQIEQLYRTLLGREIGDVGREYWSKDLERGLSVEQIEHSIRQSAEYQARIPGFAKGGDHTGGWRVVGEVGAELEYTGPSRIYSNAQSRELLDLSPVVKGLKQLDERLYRLEGYQRQTTKNTGAAARYQERWDKAGLKTRATA